MDMERATQLISARVTRPHARPWIELLLRVEAGEAVPAPPAHDPAGPGFRLLLAGHLVYQEGGKVRLLGRGRELLYWIRHSPDMPRPQRAA